MSDDILQAILDHELEKARDRLKNDDCHPNSYNAGWINGQLFILQNIRQAAEEAKKAEGEKWYKCDFPFVEIRMPPDGDLWPSIESCLKAGYVPEQIWSITEGEPDDDSEGNCWLYGPSHHYVNLLGYVVTKETHDGKTYYEEQF